jgi:hypothetical protein
LFSVAGGKGRLETEPIGAARAGMEAVVAGSTFAAEDAAKGLVKGFSLKRDESDPQAAVALAKNPAATIFNTFLLSQDVIRIRITQHPETQLQHHL